LSPGAGDTGKGPHVFDGRISVEARNIQMGLSAQKINADTNVRTQMVSPQNRGRDDNKAVKMPSMLKQDQPVNVKSNRLDYDSANAMAKYEGNARLWQDPDTEIRADTLIVEDKTGTLRAISHVTTQMSMMQS